MGWHLPTRTYVARRTAEGLSKPEIIRCLKRYLARELYRIITAPPASPPLTAPGDEAASSDQTRPSVLCA